ncbi:molecular chaperone DnaJ [Novosphingobium sp. M1R2S20]|uniref:Molecular chaperone DnaJ n=1 Tax=Novosphingobium rhizovicinum TaxID=3228928 RepID=A0ABV3R9N6_9SPHN
MKFIVLLALALVAWRLVTGRWPWQPKLAPRRSAVRQRARTLLGVQPGAGRREIVEAHRRLLATVHPDRGGSNELVHEANAARDVLLAELPPHANE